MALLVNNVPVVENFYKLALENVVTEPVAPEEDQENDDSLGVVPDLGADSNDEPQLGNDNDDYRAGKAHESVNDSGLGDDDKDESTKHVVPQSPLSPATQLPQSPEINAN